MQKLCKEYLSELKTMKLFYGIQESEMTAMLGCIGAYLKEYKKNQYIITLEENVEAVGILLSGKVDMIKEDLLNSELVVLQHEIPLETVKYAIDICYEKGVKILLNPAPAYALNEELIKKVTYITPNEHEAKIIFGGNNKLEDLLRKYKEKLIVTLGEKGVVCCLSDGNILQVPCRKSNVVDTTGAGDTLNGALAA